MAKNNSELKGIRKKLVAAIAMVLVATIMVVSSSYAWFTLSTAPEVTGIQTAVGSNGNLEIALRTGALADITTSPGGDTSQWPTSNAYWGNLVDLSHSNYHMDLLALRPARLNAELVDGTGEQVGDKYIPASYKFATGGYLKTPVYGVDGRVSELSAENVVNGFYDTSSGAFKEALPNQYGVRAIGVTSDISPDALRLRNAKAAVNAAISNSKTSATISLRDDSVKLADIIVTNVLDASATFGATEVANIQSAIEHLKSIKDELEGALKQAVVAVGVYEGKTFDITAVDFTKTDLTDDTVDLAWTNLTTQQEDLLVAYGKLATIQTALEAADGAVTPLVGRSDITFDQISVPLTHLLSTGDFEIIDSATGTSYTVTQFKDKVTADAFAAVKIILGTPTISIVDGVYYNVAEFSGNYSATTSMTVTGSYGGVTLTGETITVVMATAADTNKVDDQGEKVLPNGFHLPYVVNWMSGLTIANAGGSELITDIYGYAVDLAFRTNAAGSSLLLQTEAVNRVEDSTATQGAGSYMEFKSGHADFTLQQVANLMQHIRVVFMNEEGQIYGVAALDVTLVPVYTDAANSVRKEADANSVFTEVVGTGAEAKTYELMLANAELTQNGTAIKAPLEMYNFSVEEGGVLKLEGKKASSVITTLEQNTPKGVTAMVFLDGDKVENKDVAIAGNSMSGTLNLQFASDAELDPMDYSYPQLQPPTTSISGDTLTITGADENATAYDIYAGDAKIATIQVDEETGTVPAVDLSTLITTPGTYKITVAATARNYANSDKVTAGDYTVVPPTTETQPTP